MNLSFLSCGSKAVTSTILPRLPIVIPLPDEFILISSSRVLNLALLPDFDPKDFPKTEKGPRNDVTPIMSCNMSIYSTVKTKARPTKMASHSRSAVATRVAEASMRRTVNYGTSNYKFEYMITFPYVQRPSQRLRSGRDVVSIYGTFTQNIQQVHDI